MFLNPQRMAPETGSPSKWPQRVHTPKSVLPQRLRISPHNRVNAVDTEKLADAIRRESSEIAAVILLLAIVAAITLTMRRRPGLKQQNIARQVAVRAQDRVRIVKMDAESREDES